MATSAELLALFRLNPVDAITPYRWADAQVYSWLSEAQREACTRSDLIFDTSTSSICHVSIVAGTASYSISPLIVRVNTVFLVDGEGNRERLSLYNRDEMDSLFPDWRTEEEEPDGCIIEGITLTLNRVPVGSGTLYLEVIRLPTASISSSSQPEIPSIHHEELVSWAVYRAYQIDDDGADRPRGLWKTYLDRFNRYFGLKPNADLKRKTRTNIPHAIKAWW